MIYLFQRQRLSISAAVCLQEVSLNGNGPKTALTNIFVRMLFNYVLISLVLADFQKAFDLVSHDILIEELRIYGLDEFSLGLMRSFLHSRSARLSAEVHNLRPRLSLAEYHRCPYSLHYFSWCLQTTFPRECRNQPQLISSQMIRLLVCPRHTKILLDYVLRSVRAPVNSRTGLELNRFKSNTENEDKVYVCNWK